MVLKATHSAFQDMPANLWVSGTYWDTERELEGSFLLNNNGDTLDFSIVQSPTKPWSVGIGGQATFSRECQSVVQIDTNFDDMLSLLFSIGYRF